MGYAHSRPDCPREQWQPLDVHLRAVAATSKLARIIFGHLAVKASLNLYKPRGILLDVEIKGTLCGMRTCE